MTPSLAPTPLGRHSLKVSLQADFEPEKECDEKPRTAKNGSVGFDDAP
jgi:hypothetical protein